MSFKQELRSFIFNRIGKEYEKGFDRLALVNSLEVWFDEIIEELDVDLHEREDYDCKS